MTQEQGAPWPEPAQEAQSAGYMPGCPLELPATPDFYTAEQMHAYRAAGVAEERERCARIANAQGTSSGQRIAESIRRGT